MINDELQWNSWYFQVKKLWIDGYSFSCNNSNVIKNNNAARHNFNGSQANNNANNTLNNDANINNAAINANANHYEAQLGRQQPNYVLSVGVA